MGAAGRRFGKSHLGGHELVIESQASYLDRFKLWDLGIRKEFWIVGPEYSDSEKEFRVFWNDCKRLGYQMDRPGSYNNPEGGPMIVSLWRGAFQVHAKSSKYPDQLAGEGLSGVIMAEAAKMKQKVWAKYIRPALADFNGWSLWLSTPEGKNWFYDLWFAARHGLEDWAAWRFPSWINTKVFPLGTREDPEILAMIRDMQMSPEMIKQEIEASFTEFVGRVFKDFDEEVHVKPVRYQPLLPVFGAVDYGWTNPFVWLEIQVDKVGNVYVLREYYATQKDTNENALELMKRGLGMNARMFYPDPSEPDDTHTLEEKLRVRSSTTYTGGPLRTRLELIRGVLKPALEGEFPVRATNAAPDIGAPKLIIDPSCVNLIREMLDYRYPETKAESVANPKEEPMKKDDHGPEALGRFMLGYFGPPRAGSPRSRKAQVRR
jgi:hypothetical protein